MGCNKLIYYSTLIGIANIGFNLIKYINILCVCSSISYLDWLMLAQSTLDGEWRRRKEKGERN